MHDLISARIKRYGFDTMNTKCFNYSIGLLKSATVFVKYIHRAMMKTPR